MLYAFYLQTPGRERIGIEKHSPMTELSSRNEHDEPITAYAGDDELLNSAVYCGDRQLAMIDGLLHDLFSDDGFATSDDMSV